MEGLFTVKDLLKFERLMSQYKLQIRAQMIRTGKWCTGRTYNSITPYAEALSNGSILKCGLKTSMPIAVASLETGRRAGKVPLKFTDIIYQWSIDKRISFSSAKARKKFAGAVAHKIMTDGTRQFRAGKDTSIYSDYEKLYEDKLMGFVRKMITSKVKTNIKFL